MARRATAQSSGKPRPSPTSAEQFSLAGPSDLPDPSTNAYRKDLADIALAGRVIASHYAEPIGRHVSVGTDLRASAADEAEVIGTLRAGEPFDLLDDSLGWAWGYAGEDRRVGYVRSEALRA
jgi:hypothetical protein